MKRLRYKPRWQSLSVALRMMVVMALAAGLIVGCADKPTYEVDFDQSFPFAQYKTCCIPSECSSRARRLLTVGCERFKC